MLVADLPNAAHELGRCRDESTLSLNRLEHDRCDLLGSNPSAEGRLELGKRCCRIRAAIVARKRNAIDLGSEGTEACLVRVRFRCEAERQEGPAVEAAVESDHRRTLRVGARELDRVLNCLCARVEEADTELARDGSQRDQSFGQAHVVLVGNDREVRVRKAGHLLLRRFDHARVRVADVHTADTACKVDEGIAVHVGDRGAVALGDHERQVDRERVRDDPLLALEDLLAARARNVRPHLNRSRRRHAPELID